MGCFSCFSPPPSERYALAQPTTEPIEEAAAAVDAAPPPPPIPQARVTGPQEAVGQIVSKQQQQVDGALPQVGGAPLPSIVASGEPSSTTKPWHQLSCSI